MKPKSCAREMAGFGLLEMLLALTLIGFAVIAAASFMVASSGAIAALNRERTGQRQSAEIISRLKARGYGKLQEGGAFAVEEPSGQAVTDASGTLTIACSDAFCDKLVRENDERGKPREVIKNWSATPTADEETLAVRAWTIKTEDAQRGLRRITALVVFPGANLPVAEKITYVTDGGE